MSNATTQSPSEFAIKSVFELLQIARGLSKVPGVRKFSVLLATALENVHEYLKTSIQQLDKTIVESEVVKLLTHLEKLCQLPYRKDSSAGDTFCVKDYPALNKLLKKHHLSARSGIKYFANDREAKKQRVSLLKLLNEFTNPENHARDVNQCDIEPSDLNKLHDHQAHLQTLYASLASNCLCVDEDGHNGVTVNFHLRSCCFFRDSADESTDTVSFRLFFLDHPHVDKDITCQWQDSLVYVRRNMSVKFENERKSRYSSQDKPTKSFCGMISTRTKTSLEFTVSNDNLQLRGRRPFSNDFHLNSSSISLAELLETEELSSKKKTLLSYFLSVSFWQFYDSHWMRSAWTKHSVHFMFEQRSGIPKGIFLDHLFLSTRFDGTDSHSKATENDAGASILRRLPALGIMLLEIELNVNIEEHRIPETLMTDADELYHPDHSAAMELFKQAELWEEKGTLALVKNLISLCIFADTIKLPLKDRQSIRHFLVTEFIEPLHALYQNNYQEDPETSSVNSTKLKSSALSNLEIRNNHPRHYLSLAGPSSPQRKPAISAARVPTCPVTTHFDHTRFDNVKSPRVSQGATMSTSDSSVTSKDWFRELDVLNSILRPKSSDKDEFYKPAKIAILDTGAHHGSSEYVKESKDFVNKDNSEYQDNTGHGTNAVRLISLVYNKAEMYVGRVFDDSNATSDTPILMAEAIRHAVNTWKVEIIIISSGFKLEDAELERAVDEAQAAKTLVFAAASNHGNLYDIAFPGSLYVHQKLFCMFSTDPNVRALPSYNPTVSSKEIRSFAILGQNIQLPRNEVLGQMEQSLSGTSFATMIGGAIAARILDFSQQKGIRGKIARIERLRTVGGMSKIFAEMAKSTDDNGYYCIAPWKILPRYVTSQDWATERLSQRDYVRETISRALINALVS